MKIMHIVGNRPQFIKLAPVSRKLRESCIEEVIVHTGQHYDKNMSDIFFSELEIPKPTVNLDVGSGTHAQVTSRIMSKLECVAVEENPDGVLVYGDTNSTLAAALVISKLNIPLFHIEAGPRTFSRTNPEEKNRVVTDHLSDYLFAPDKISVKNLIKEGIDQERVIFSGDVMYDQFLYGTSKSDGKILERCPEKFILMTWHRQENTCNRNRVEKMLDFINQIDIPIVLPVHPRTRKIIEKYNLWNSVCKNKNLHLVEPVGYKEMAALMNHCICVISDSGGASKEASFAGKICFFPLKLSIWPELIEAGYINVVDIEDETEREKSIFKIKQLVNHNITLEKVNFFGDGNASDIIVHTIKKVLS